MPIINTDIIYFELTKQLYFDTSDTKIVFIEIP